MSGGAGGSKTGGVLGRGIQIVSFLFGAFSGFIPGVAPPDETSPQFTVGIASFGVLVIFLLIVAIARSRRLNFVWIAVAAVLFAVFIVYTFKYQDDRSRLTILWPPGVEEQKLYAVGEVLTKRGDEAMRNNPSLVPTTLISGFGGIDPEQNADPRPKIWTQESIRAAGRTLLRDYLVLVLSLCGAIFCLTEGVLRAAAPPPAKSD